MVTHPAASSMYHWPRSGVPLTPTRVASENVDNAAMSQNDLSRIMHNMMGPKYICYIAQCQTMFHSSDALRQHQMAVHPNDLLSCNICQKTFSRKQYLQQHVRVMHTQRPRFACSRCGKTYASKQTMQIHMQTCKAGNK